MTEGDAQGRSCMQNRMEGGGANTGAGGSAARRADAMDSRADSDAGARSARSARPRPGSPAESGANRIPWQTNACDERAALYAGRSALPQEDGERGYARRRQGSVQARMCGAEHARSAVREMPAPRLTGQRPSKEQPPSLVVFFKRSIKGMVLVAVVAVLVTAVAIVAGALLSGSFATGGLSQNGTLAVHDASHRFQSAFDWRNLSREGGRLSYVVDGERLSRFGIDVSEHNLDIDWSAAAADGVEFAFIRVGYRGTDQGGVKLDARFADNLAGAQRAGIDCGVYFFSQAVTVEEAHEEAAFVLDALAGASLDCPVAFDSEVVPVGAGKSRTARMTDDEMSAVAEAFCLDVEAAGYEPLVYGNAHDLSRYDSSLIARVPVWWAEYNVLAPVAWFDMSMWQYANDGSVAGIPTNVDLNIDLAPALAASGR